MPSQAISTAGAKFQVGDGASPTEAFSDLPEVTVISNYLLFEVNEEAVDSFDTDFNEEPKLPLGSRILPFDIEINLVPSLPSHDRLITDAYAQTKRNYRILIPGGKRVSIGNVRVASGSGEMRPKSPLKARFTFSPDSATYEDHP